MRVFSAYAVASLLILHPVAAAGVRPHLPFQSTNRHPTEYHSSNDRRQPLFPILTKIRDEAVELLFGRHPTKADADSPSFPDIRALYHNEIVLRFNVTTFDEEAALAEAAARLFLDIWAFTDEFVDIRLHVDVIGPLLKLLPSSLQSSHSTLIPDLPAAVYESISSVEASGVLGASAESWSASPHLQPADNLFFQDYQPLPVISRWLRLLEAMFPSFVEYVIIGHSFEGREIPGLRVGLSSMGDPAEPRKTLVVTGGLHAREWISTTTVNYLAWSFITSYGKEQVITKLLEEFDIVFIPAVNPDGIEYTWKVDRLWRKSRQDTSFRFCRGMDLDHAFGYEWDASHIQSDPCSESYGGEEPFQATEAQQLADWARNQTLHNVKFVGLIDLHSYSQQVLYPYTYSCAVAPPNLENLEELGAGLAKAIRLSNGESYSVASACEGAVAAEEAERGGFGLRLESGGGSAIDWFYHELGARYSYQIKLRDTGSYGFLLPKEHIIPTGEEMLNALKYFGDFLLGNNGIEKHFDTTTEGSKDPENTEANASSGTASETVNDTSGQELRKRRLRR
ncbi:hypothetical protein NLU13_1636 [Sarocladium strictum]|uniref:Inactive metallocarboxypeptidase ECM14 n=1 Tax=Sarocladium strictum TaxID=5046 RepID=A0AA39GRB5_SARSR|nr:hypothetical protein NLU13_1636 [Sarocladium strictum]